LKGRRSASLLDRFCNVAKYGGMSKTRPPRPRDMNQLAKRIVDISVGEAEDEPIVEAEKNPHAVALGRLGGLRGGKVRAERLAPEKRREIARVAARSRWNKRPSK
jgi:hypothetical protein